jgi:hypothetical protein
MHGAPCSGPAQENVSFLVNIVFLPMRAGYPFYSQISKLNHLPNHSTDNSSILPMFYSSSNADLILQTAGLYCQCSIYNKYIVRYNDAGRV